MRNSPLPLLLVGMAWLGVVGSADDALAQDRVPRQAIVATNQLDDDQRQQIDAFLDKWVGVFKNDAVTQERLTDAREKLVEPLRTPGATSFFKQFYSRTLTQRLTPLTDDQRLMVRLNVAVIVGHTTTKGGVELAIKGLRDQNPAIRYRAAHAMESIFANMSDKSQLPIKEKLNLLQTLAQMSKQVQSTQVLKQIMQAMAALDQPGDGRLPKAIEQTLDSLSARLKWHVDQPYESYLAEHAGLGAVYQRLLNSDSPNPAHVIEMARVADRYMALISRHLIDAKGQQQNAGTSPIDPDERRQHTEMLRLCNYVLRFAYNALDSDVPQPKNIQELITFENWREIRRIATEKWRDVLTSPPFNIPAENLSIVDPEDQKANAQ